MNIKLLTEHHLEFLSLKGDCTGSSESTLVKMPYFGNLMSRLKCSLALQVSNELPYLPYIYHPLFTCQNKRVHFISWIGFTS